MGSSKARKHLKMLVEYLTSKIKNAKIVGGSGDIPKAELAAIRWLLKRSKELDEIQNTNHTPQFQFESEVEVDIGGEG
jgi:hypothetical protein